MRTHNSTKVIGLEDRLGTLKEGKYANIIAVDGDPLEDMRLLQNKDRVKLVKTSGMTRERIL